MRNTLLRSLAVRVKEMSICLIFAFLFASVVAQAQITTGAIQARDANRSTVPAGSVIDTFSESGDGPESNLPGAQPSPTPIQDNQRPGKEKVNSPYPDVLKRWGLSLHAGVSIPHGDFNSVFNPGPNFAIDLEYRINRTFSLEGIYGFHRFNGDTFGSFTLADVNVHQLSLNGKVYGGTSPTRPFFNFGGGAYNFGSGPATHGGLNVGVGVQHDVTPGFAVEGVYNFHNVFTSGSSTRFSGVQGGVRFRF